jgi:sulfur relay (sulfurtransferase) DsrC/TusE family protein
VINTEKARKLGFNGELKFLKEHGKVIIYVIIWYSCFHTTSKCKYLIEMLYQILIGISNTF